LIWIYITLALIILGFLAVAAGFGILIYYRRHEAKRLEKDLTHFPNDRSHWVEIGGAKLHYVVEGSGPDVILIHGIAANIYCWRKVIPLLAQKNRVWAIDLLGFGHSDKPVDGDYSAAAQAKIIREFMLHVGINEKVTLVGSSMGGSISTRFTVDYPQLVSHLVLCNAAINRNAVVFDLRKIRRIAPVFAPFINKFTVRQILKHIAAPGFAVENLDVDAYLKPYSKHYDSILSFIASFDILLDMDLWTQTKNIQIPTLLLWGEKDNVVPVKLAVDLEKSFPNCSLKIHPDSGHHLQEEVPEWFAENIFAFLSSPEGAAKISPSQQDLRRETS
jgi:pimeloyl-ACP methyl ester carboxylesterase